MNKPAASNLNRQILEEACEWFVSFRVGDVDASARERFDEWLRRSPEHIRAYWEIAKTYVELPLLTPPDEVEVARLIAYAQSHDSVVSLHPVAGTQAPQVLRMDRDAHVYADSANRARRRNRRVPRRIFAAASAIFVLVTAGVVWQTQRYPLYTTDIGERRSITLTDGSTLDLNARSKVRVEFSGAERRVELLDGQALFDVAKDPQRPFIVRSGEAIVRAVGTQFDVYRKDSGTTVTVLEGRVAVYNSTYHEASATTERTPQRRTSDAQAAQQALDNSGDAHSSSARSTATSTAAAREPPPRLLDPSGSTAVLVSAGEQVTVMPDVIATPHHADPAVATAWMQRKLVFEGSRLADVVQEFNRYNRTQLVIEDPQLGDFQISGVYSSTDPASLLRFLRDQGVRVSEVDGEVRLAAQ